MAPDLKPIRLHLRPRGFGPDGHAAGPAQALARSSFAREVADQAGQLPGRQPSPPVFAGASDGHGSSPQGKLLDTSRLYPVFKGETGQKQARKQLIFGRLRRV